MHHQRQTTANKDLTLRTHRALHLGWPAPEGAPRLAALPLLESLPIARIGSAGCERIEHLDPEGREVAGVSGPDHVAENEGGCGDQSVDEQVVRAPVGEAAPKAKHSAVERQDLPGLLYTVDPREDRNRAEWPGVSRAIE